MRAALEAEMAKVKDQYPGVSDSQAREMAAFRLGYRGELPDEEEAEEDSDAL